MKLENEFVVPAPVERAWALLLDVERIAPCVPGATIEGRDGDAFQGTMKLKLGPMVNTFNGTLELEEADEAQRRSVMRAQARAARGQGNAAATITSALAPDGDGTRVSVQTELRVTGPLAQFGRGVMQDVSAKLMDQFAQCLAAELADAPAGEDATVELPAVAPATEAATEAATDAPETAPTEPPAHTPPPRRSADVLDVAEVGREAVLRRALPAVAALIALAIALRIVRRARG